VDNGSSLFARSMLQSTLGSNDLILLQNETNRGLAQALNQGIRLGIERGYEWFVLLDQDTTPDPRMVATLQSIVSDVRMPTNVGIVGSTYRSATIAIRDTTRVAGEQRWRETPVVITSGMLIPRRTFDKIGYFREDFFVDIVDFELCLRARSQGLKVMLTTIPLMEHQIGSPKSHRIFGRTVWPTYHSPFRRYLMTRNSILLLRLYFMRERRWSIIWARTLFKYTLKALAFEPCRLETLQWTTLGVIDGLLGRYHRNTSTVNHRTSA